MEINGKTRTCGLIGNPVEHTLSPMIHNTLAEMFGHNLVYVPFPVEKGRAAEAVTGASALGILGLNVTVPYKSEVIPCLREVDSLAVSIGAVNTLVSVSDGYKGYNTDMEGLYRAMTAEGVKLAGEEIILLGAGGASRAVAYLCAVKQAKRVYMLNRTVDKAKLVAVGLYPNGDQAVIEDEAFYRRIHTGFDLIYRPWETRFMKLVRENGGQAYNGLKMLLYQGVIAYELWNGVEVSEKEAQIVYEKLRKAVS